MVSGPWYGINASSSHDGDGWEEGGTITRGAGNPSLQGSASRSLDTDLGVFAQTWTQLFGPCFSFLRKVAALGV